MTIEIDVSTITETELQNICETLERERQEYHARLLENHDHLMNVRLNLVKPFDSIYYKTEGKSC